ncbi:MAG: hypothetical protein ACXVC7_10135, partial [Bacteroidia bacterium]
MKVKIVLIIIFFLSLSSSRAFDHILHLEKKIFYPHEFNFNVIRVIDARISKEEPIGFVKNGIRAKIVGNIDLEKDMTSFVLDSVFFRKQNPIILVVNQVNFRPMPGEQGFVICFDYYKADGDSVSLIFSQTSRFTHESTTNSGNGINKTYSKAIEQAFLDFKNHLYFYKPFPSKTIHIKDLEKSFTVVNKKV